MWRALVFVAGCSAPAEPTVDAAAIALTCEDFDAMTVAAPEFHEVRVPGTPFHTPGVSYVAEDGASTWTRWVRRWDGRLGSYGRIDRLHDCEWRDGLETRATEIALPTRYQE